MRASLTDDPRRRLCGRDDQHLLDVPASEPVAVMDRRTHEGITTGTVTLPRRPVHVGVWFRLLRTLLDEVNTPTSQLRRQLSKQALRQIWQTAGRPTRAGQIRWLPYEELDWPRQQAMLEAAAVAMHLVESGALADRGTLGPLLREEPTARSSATRTSRSIVGGARWTSSPPRSTPPVPIAKPHAD